MLANGLVQNIAECIRRPVFLLHSGPAAAPSGAVYLGKHLGEKNLLSVDMGGTSFDVCVIDKGEIPTTTEHWENDQRVAIKMVDIASIGAGGGSMAKIDALGLLRVGPQSAGADPGPACYGTRNRRDGNRRQSDSRLCAGRLFPRRRNETRRKSIAPRDEAVDGKARRSTKRAPPKRFSARSMPIWRIRSPRYRPSAATISATRIMIAGGGGGPIHGGFIADSARHQAAWWCRRSQRSTALSACSPWTSARTTRAPSSAAPAIIDLDALNRVYAELEAEAQTAFQAHGVPHPTRSYSNAAPTCDMSANSTKSRSTWPAARSRREAVDAAAAVFARKHEELYTFAMPWKAVEILTLRLKASTPNAPFALPQVEQGGADPKPALKRRRICRFNGRDIDTPVYDGEKVTGRKCHQRAGNHRRDNDDRRDPRGLCLLGRQIQKLHPDARPDGRRP